MLDVAIEVLRGIAGAAVGDEAFTVIETDQAAAADHFADHVVREISLVGADSSGVGVGRDERTAGGLKEIGISGII